VIENTTKEMSMDEQTKNYIEMLRDEMIDEPVAMTVPTEWVRAVLDALATVTAERDAGKRFYGLITEHMRAEGGIPMTDALGECIDAIEASNAVPTELKLRAALMYEMVGNSPRYLCKEIEDARTAVDNVLSRPVSPPSVPGGA
jgi:hypothetical protein